MAEVRPTKAYFGGTFDLVHLGHIRIFERAKKKYGRVVVAVNTDQYVRDFKGKYPLYSLEERMEFLRSIRHVDEVVMNLGGKNCIPSILNSGATHIVAGSDWRPREKYLESLGLTEDRLQDFGLEIVFEDSGFAFHGFDIKKRIRES